LTNDHLHKAKESAVDIAEYFRAKEAVTHISDYLSTKPNIKPTHLKSKKRKRGIEKAIDNNTRNFQQEGGEQEE
jgi:hypothetical protein